jgi:beta-glucosidase
LKSVLLDLQNNYGNPTVYILENGCSLPDKPEENGIVADWERVNYLRAHLHAIHQAMQAGADLRGYFVWSLMDNFEWSWGYSRRFGLVHVDFTNLRRTPKQSAYWYRDIIAQNAVDI